MAGLLSLAVCFLTYQILRSRAQLEALLASLETSQGALQQDHQQLLQTEQQHLSLLQNLHAGVLVHAPDSRIVYCNAQAAVLLRLTHRNSCWAIP